MNQNGNIVNNQTNNKTLIPLYKFGRNVVMVSALISYAVLLPILAFTAGKHNQLSNDECIGLLIAAIFILCGALVWASWLVIRIRQRAEINVSQNLFLLIRILVFVPFAGLITNWILFYLNKRNYKRSQLEINKNWKMEKRPGVCVQVLLVQITFYVVLVIWLWYAIKGHTFNQDSVTPDNHEGSNYVIPGVFDVLKAPVDGFIDAAPIIVFLLIIGFFLQVINSTKALEAGIGRLAKKLQGKELVIIPIFMIFFSIGGATFGMCEETIAFYPIVMPVILAAGFDAVVGVMVILMGAGLGVCASVINPFLVVTANDAYNKNLSGSDGALDVSSGVVFRLIAYIVLVGIGITYVMLYAKKIKNNPAKSIVYDLSAIHKSTFKFDENAIPEFTTKRKITLIIFAMAFVLLIFGTIPWDTLTHWNGFKDLNNWLLRVFPFISSNSGYIGSWYLDTYGLLFIAGALIVALMNWKGANAFYQDCVIGSKDFISVAFVIAIARGLSIILTNSGFQIDIINGLSHVLGNWIGGTILMFLAFFVISIFIPSTSGFAYAVFGPIAGPALATKGLSVSGGVMSSSLANGLVNLTSPTAGPFVIGCEYAKLPLSRYYRHAWKLLVTIAVASLIMLLAGAAIYHYTNLGDVNVIY